MPIKVTVARKKRKKKGKGKKKAKERFDWIAMTRDETNEWMNG